MRRELLALLLASAVTCAITVGISAQRSPPPQPPVHDDHSHHHPKAARLKNPVPPSDASIAAGQKLFERYCASCHGATGKGDGPRGAGLQVADLTDAQWKHGETDGEIFTVIRDGARPGMRKFGHILKPEQMWSLVNYVRTLQKP